MNVNKDLVIINNEKISKEKTNFYCDNIDVKSIPEDLDKKFSVTLIARNSKDQRMRQINIEKIRTASNIFTFLFSILKTFKKKEAIYLIISITPYTFFSYILLFIFRKKIYVYLRSNGYEEYKAILGFIGPVIYHLMFKLVTFKSKVISCQERLFTKRKSHIVFPSELNYSWLENVKKPKTDKPRLLYVGRLKVEKGVFSLLEIFSKATIDAQLSIVGRIEKNLFKKNLTENKNIVFLGHGFESPKLIDIYDESNIFILPSFTEAHPKVIDESLARGRPVIIFEEIEHIIQNRNGIFVSKRDVKSFVEKINFVMENYSNIQESMKKNMLPTKKEFISQMSNILNDN